MKPATLNTPGCTPDIHKIEHRNLEPADAFRILRHMPYVVWLDSGFPNPDHGRFDILSCSPAQRIGVSSSDPEQLARFESNAQQLLDELGSPSANPSLPFQGGLIGYLGYDLYRQRMGLEAQPASLIPDAHLGLYLWALAYDHHRQIAQLIFHSQCDIHLKQHVLEKFRRVEQYPGDGEFELRSVFAPSEPRERYSANIACIKDYIGAGDIYQANYAHHFSASYRGDCARAYLSQRTHHPAPCSAYIALDNNQAVLCHSPEDFLQIQGRQVRTMPIKGTAPRAEDSRLDQRNAEVLRSSAKDRAENLMIVDLLRNDLGKTCEPGSIHVPRLFDLQSFSNVHHLVSEVCGHLKPDVQPLDVIRDCHPGGSITGAPKRRAMEIIDSLEAMPRSVYCGNIGYLSSCGQSATNIAIRTMVADGDQMHCWGGGGIVADSDIDREYQETLFKVGPLMRSLEADFLAQRDGNRS